jgi:hypothetical protein
LNSSLSANLTKSDTEAILEKLCKYLWLYQKVCMMSHCNNSCYSNVIKISGNKPSELPQKNRLKLVFILLCSLIYSALSGPTLDILVSIWCVGRANPKYSKTSV